jgi:hypothetical protein
MRGGGGATATRSVEAVAHVKLELVASWAID